MEWVRLHNDVVNGRTIPGEKKPKVGAHQDPVTPSQAAAVGATHTCLCIKAQLENGANHSFWNPEAAERDQEPHENDTGARAGLFDEAIPVSKLKSGAIRCPAFDVRFG